MGFFVAMLVSLALNIVAYLIQPGSGSKVSNATEDMDDPVAEAGKPIPVLFGTMTIKGINILWFGEKQITTYKKYSSSKK